LAYCRAGMLIFINRFSNVLSYLTVEDVAFWHFFSYSLPSQNILQHFDHLFI
jgi:hypothetical protein